jgi:hypothetical protein
MLNDSPLQSKDSSSFWRSPSSIESKVGRCLTKAVEKLAKNMSKSFGR